MVGVDVPALMQFIGDSAVGPLAKFAVAFPFTYHFMCGLRHMNWDSNPDDLNTENVTKSSVVLVASSAAISVIASFL